MNPAQPVVRIAMWSGPRNISTAMMRAFENRPDAIVVDEPLYGPYLAATGLDHPYASEVIAAQGSAWAPAVERLFGPLPDGVTIHYQKHMTHHLLDDAPRDWVDEVVNCFLIRDPARVVASYAKRRDSVTMDDLGFRQQVEIFDRISDDAGAAPPVLDAADVLADPAGMLRALCAAVGIGFDDRMLSWPSGPRASDGVWAPHWYDAVWESTGFVTPAPMAGPPVIESPDAAEIAGRAGSWYERLRQHRLRPLA